MRPLRIPKGESHSGMPGNVDSYVLPLTHCRFPGRHKLHFLHFGAFFQKMRQLLSLPRSILIALHLTFAQNSYCGCEFCIFLYSIICNKLSICYVEGSNVASSELLSLSHCWFHGSTFLVNIRTFTLLVNIKILHCWFHGSIVAVYQSSVVSCRSASDSHCRPFLPSPGNC